MGDSPGSSRVVPFGFALVLALGCQGPAAHPTSGKPKGAPPRAPLPCFVDEGTPAGSAITLAVAPSRVAGVAPLAVYFDTLETTAQGSTRPFHELAYCWDFGDERAGSFMTTGLSKNQAKGAIAAHVFETPGVYTVRTTARDAQGRVASSSVDITVSDPARTFAGEATVCFSTSDNFSGCPAGAQQVRASSMSALEPHLATGKRLLLRRGQTFAGASLQINVPGPGMIGAFGSGDRPRIEGNGSFYISDQEPVFSDWRIADLDMVSNGNVDSGWIWLQGKGDHLLVLRVRAVGYANGIVGATDLIDHLISQGFTNQDIFDALTLQECEIRDVVGGQGHSLGFVASHRFMLLGSTMLNSTQGEHVLRAPWLDRAILSNNVLGGAPEPRHVLKLNAPIFDQGTIGRGRYTEHVVISDNVFQGDGGHRWTVAISPENGDFDERVRDVIVERNFFTPGPAVTLGIEVSGQDITIRDNIFNRGTESGCVDVDQLGIEPVPTRIVLVNNTCYSSGASGFVTFNESGTTASVFNNLLVTSGGGSVAEGPASITEGGNVVTSAPGFTNGRPTEWRDFGLVVDSPGVDSGDGATFSVWDYTGRPRPVDGNSDGTSAPDVGALERIP
jgi:hypothetical protein